jgi:hypothetical protein
MSNTRKVAAVTEAAKQQITVPPLSFNPLPAGARTLMQKIQPGSGAIINPAADASPSSTPVGVRGQAEVMR